MAAACAILLARAAKLLHAQIGGCPLRIIVPLSLGSTGDVVSWRLVTGLSKALGRTIYVDNVPGRAGSECHEH
jgi:tripartite-type tricarboxylate transporter receptor subunit TctC